MNLGEHKHPVYSDHVYEFPPVHEQLLGYRYKISGRLDLTKAGVSLGKYERCQRLEDVCRRQFMMMNHGI